MPWQVELRGEARPPLCPRETRGGLQPLDMPRRMHHIAGVTSSARIVRILELATELSREEKEEVAAELLASLEPDDELVGEAWNVAWRAELQRRIGDPSPGVAWEDARAQLDARLTAVRAERSGR